MLGGGGASRCCCGGCLHSEEAEAAPVVEDDAPVTLTDAWHRSAVAPDVWHRTALVTGEALPDPDGPSTPAPDASRASSSALAISDSGSNEPVNSAVVAELSRGGVAGALSQGRKRSVRGVASGLLLPQH